MTEPARRHLPDDQGATMLEYGMMISLIAAVVAVVAAVLGTRVADVYTAVTASF